MSDVWAPVRDIDKDLAKHGVASGQIRAFFIVAEANNVQDPADLCAKIQAWFGALADVEPLFEHAELARFLLLRFPTIDYRLVQGIAFELAYDLRARFALKSAEPRLDAPFFPEPSQAPIAPATEEALVQEACEVKGPPPANKHWAIDMMRAGDAIAFARDHGKAGGGLGVTIGQPDTGYRQVAELEDGAIHPSKGWNAMTKKPDAADPLGYAGNPGHGTATASCAVSRAAGDMMGTAPNATLYPVRCIDAVVVLQPDTVSRAIAHCCDPNLKIDVITMSLGGLPSRALRAAIRLAIKSDIIVMAAAGNCVGLVVWPARYSECIAVAGCNEKGFAWKGSCRGEAVDVTAPAEMVWHAAVEPGLKIKDGQGTSFAVALTAGAAAQWVEFHGRPALQAAAHAQNAHVQDLFKAAMKASAKSAPNLEPGKFGKGIVDVRKLLELPLANIVIDPSDITRFDDHAGDAMPHEYREIMERFSSGALESAPGFDWTGFGAEMAYIALDRAVLGKALDTTIEATPAPAASDTLTAAVRAQPNAALKSWVEGAAQ
jgi:serine protease